MVYRLLIGLGYFIGLSNCVLEPTTSLIFLGMGINSQSFTIPPAKKAKFAQHRENLPRGNTLSTDASEFQWAAVIHLPSGDMRIGDYWPEELRNGHINVKEMYAIANAVDALPADVRDERVDVQVDNQVALHA